MIISNVTIGADPELFIINEKTKKVVSSIGIIPGEKGDPWVGDDMPSGFGIEIDNILGEFNIPPARSREEFVNSIEYMKNYINRFVKEKNPDLGIQCIASRMVDESQLQSDEAKLFGCSPDYNAYTEEVNKKPNGANTNLRSAGFHVHIGYNNPTIDTSLAIIRLLDIYLGLPSVVIDPDKKRRNLYGKAGSFRLTDYGCEYRVLSSAMMKTKDRIGFVYDQVMKVIDHLNDDKDYFLNPNEVITTINGSQVERAKKLIYENHICAEYLGL